MKGPLLIRTTIALLIATIATNVLHSEALTAVETCALVQNNSYIADPADCQGWYLCINGTAAGSGKCGNGFLYNSASGICDYADKVTCNNNITTMCTGLTGVYKADPTNCSNYCYCNDGVTYTVACPSGLYFDANSLSCNYLSQSTCDEDSPCLLCQNGFIKNSTSCDGWLRCADGQTVDSSNCPSPYLFNALTGQCDYAANVPCTSSVTSAPNTVTTTPIPPTCTDADPNSFLAVPNPEATCRGFFSCADSESDPVYGLCPEGTQFDIPSGGVGECTNSYNVVCTANRCEGSTYKWVAVPGTACGQYYNCVNGEEVGPTTLPTGSFFDEKLQSIVKALPDLPICS